MRVLFTLVSLFFSGLLAANPLNNIVVFGDSLSDTGNIYEYMQHRLPQSPPYYKGRFSNGPVWIEHLAQSYFPTNSAAHMVNYAFGGAGVSEEEGILFSLKHEIDSYLLTHDNKADVNSLFIVWMGSNNYLNEPDDVDQALAEVNIGIKHGLQQLAKAGAKHILVLNAPDLSMTPAAKASGAQDVLAYLSKRHNELLAVTVNELKRTNPEIQWLYFDVKRTMSDLARYPERYGFTNIDDTCYDAIVEKEGAKFSVLRMVAKIKAAKNEDICKGYLFFDPVHPTVLAHEIMAKNARSFLDQNDVKFVS